MVQEEIENLNSPISIKEIEFIVNNFHEETPGLDDFTGEFHPTFKEKVIPIQTHIFEKIEKEETLNHFMRPVLP